jgi:hypothetical protein
MQGVKRAEFDESRQVISFPSGQQLTYGFSVMRPNQYAIGARSLGGYASKGVLPSKPNSQSILRISTPVG